MPLAQQEEILESIAASISSNCGDTNGQISMTCFEKDFRQVFDMMIDNFLHPAFLQDRLELSKRTSKQALESTCDAPMLR
jgi:predicted Zn-dependent peptidase